MARVGIGIPVYNGERFLEEVLESVLGQTFTDLEVVICDNASTDATPEICERFAARDSRVRVVRHPENIGAAPNFNRTFELCSSEYFKWAAADDLILPEYVEECVRILDADPDVVLAHSLVQFIGTDGQILREYDAELDGAFSARPHERFGDLIKEHHWCFDVFGVIRTDALARTPLIASHIASDRTLLAELALLGRYEHVDRVLFLSRDHDDRSVRSMELEDRGAWFDPVLKDRFVLPHFRQLWEYFRAINRVGPRFGDRVLCYGRLLWWMRHCRYLLQRDMGRIGRGLVSLVGLPRPQ